MSFGLYVLGDAAVSGRGRITDGGHRDVLDENATENAQWLLSEEDALIEPCGVWVRLR
jgi:hypothetical protein